MHTKDNVNSKKNIIYNYLSFILLIALLVIGRILMIHVNLDYHYFDLGLIIIYSLVTSIHCSGMCGGLIITRIISMNKSNSTIAETIKYLLGRIISYTLIGIMLGGFGEIFSINYQLKGIVSITAGIIMLLVSLQLLNIIHLPKLKIYPHLKNSSSFLIGIINVLMPCGSLYVAMLYAIACSSYLYGGLIMFIFALITSISLLITALMASKIKSSNHLLKYMSFLIIVALGIQFISHGISYLNSNNNGNMKSHDSSEMKMNKK